MLAATTGGVCLIKDDKLAEVYDSKDGIKNIETLTIETAPNGDIMIGSNGDGIYVITDDGTKEISTKEGLASGVVMRIKYDKKRDVFWIVTGNSIAYMTTDYKVHTIKHFPYPDNFDMYENSSGQMWVLSSDGIYVVSVDKLIEDKDIEPLHYATANGLPCAAESNSYSELTDDGDLYVAGNTGIVKVNIDAPAESVSSIKQAVPFIEADGKRIYANDKGGFKISSDVKKIKIYGFVLNYSLSDPWVSYKLDGFDKEETTVRNSELDPVTYTNLPGGKYDFVMELKDDSADESQKISVTIEKKRRLREYPLFRILFLIAVILITLLLSRIYNRKKLRELEEKNREEQEKERVNRELRMANTIQMNFLPSEFPPFPDRNEFDLFASMEPAREVGGDFYDYFFIDDDHLCLVIADVSGKGIPAALYMMTSKVIIQGAATPGKTPAEILARTNDMICANNTTDMFITVWVGVLELSTGRLKAANAGHEYPAVRHGNSGFELFKDKHGLVIGAMEGMTYTDYELRLEPGDSLFIYTDGLAEATDAETEMFGTDRMMDVLNADSGASPETIVASMREAVSGFVNEAEQFDDLTMMCVVYNGPEEQ